MKILYVLLGWLKHPSVEMKVLSLDIIKDNEFVEKFVDPYYLGQKVDHRKVFSFLHRN